MDESFQLRARRLLGERQPAPLDFSVLTATLAAQRAVSAAAVAPVPVAESAGAAQGDSLIELVLAGPDWRRAASAQRGCFNRAEVRRRSNET